MIHVLRQQQQLQLQGQNTDLQADRLHSGEQGSDALPEPGKGLAPEDQGGKGAEHEPGSIHPADGWEGVQDGLQGIEQLTDQRMVCRASNLAE